MNYKIKQIVKTVLIVDGLEYLVNDKVRIYTDNGDIFIGEIIKIEDSWMKIFNMHFGNSDINYNDIKNIILVEK